MAKRKRTKRHAMIYKTLQKKPKDRATRTPLEPGVTAGAPERYAVPAPLVIPVVFLYLQSWI